MRSTIVSPAFLAATFFNSVIITGALADKITPCALGSGSENGCGYCNKTMGIDITPWMSATPDPNFNLPTAGSKVGGGYDVYWNVPQPDSGCRTLLTQPYVTDKGSINPKLSGNVILSTAHGGCYFAHVGSGGVSASFCCGSGDCSTAGAAPSKKKRELPRSRVTRNELGARCWDGQNCGPPPPPAKPAITCSPAVADGDTYTKAGAQQIDGQTLTCNGGAQCDFSPSMAVSADVSVTNEHSTSLSTTDGVSLSMTAGFQLPIGPMASVTAGVSKDWTNAVSDAMSTTNSKTVTKTLSLSVGIVPGGTFNLWFTPTLKCQLYKTTCNGVEQTFEKCTPMLDGDSPVGDHGVMAIG